MEVNMILKQDSEEDRSQLMVLDMNSITCNSNTPRKR